jgi:hypothetical protein
MPITGCGVEALAPWVRLRLRIGPLRQLGIKHLTHGVQYAIAMAPYPKTFCRCTPQVGVPLRCLALANCADGYRIALRQPPRLGRHAQQNSKVAVQVRSVVGMAKVAAHGLGLQPAKVLPLSAVAVRVTVALLENGAKQVLPQLIPAGSLVTVPLPAPALVTVSIEISDASTTLSK